jgi:hypothetical protein
MKKVAAGESIIRLTGRVKPLPAAIAKQNSRVTVLSGRAHQTVFMQLLVQGHPADAQLKRST